MDGILLDDPLVVDGIAAILPDILKSYRSERQGRQVSGTIDSKLLTEDAFQELRSAFDQTVTNLCTSLASGTIDVHPKKTKYQTPVPTVITKHLRV